MTLKRRAGLVLAAAFAVVGALNALLPALLDSSGPPSLSGGLYFIPFAAALLSLASTLLPDRWGRAIQVGLPLVVGLALVTIGLTISLTGILLYLAGFSLAFPYGFLAKGFKLKLAGAAVLLAGALLLDFLHQTGALLLYSIEILALSVAALCLIAFAIAERLRR